MQEKARHMLEAITFLKEVKSTNKIPLWYTWLDRVLALAFYLFMGYAYLSLFLWLTSAI
tara:strand:- start:513 stop:689 length:177 start_codon:yes stop_codon:yes gene_type:complete